MSKGPGTCQRCLLAALERHPAVHLHELLAADATRSQYLAMQRAARILEGKGIIGIFHIWDVKMRKRVYVLHRPGYDEQAHARLHGLEWYDWGDHGHWIRPWVRKDEEEA